MMTTLDRFLSWTLLTFGCLHTAAGVVLLSRSLNLDSAWFFSGGLAIVLGALLNLLRTYRPPDRAVARTSVLANLLLLTLAILLAWVLRHQLKGNPQAAVFVPLVAVQLLFSLRQWFQ
jgi:hypothetical protein